MSDDEIPAPGWVRALLNTAILGAISGISAWQASPEAGVRAAALAGLLTFLVQLSGLLRAPAGPPKLLTVL